MGENRKAMPSPSLFTIGYEGRSPEDFLARLRENGVERVVDVRELPLSRRRGFSKTPLAELLDRAGIRYEHVRALGNPKETRDKYKSGDVTTGIREYRAHLHNGSYGALIDLAESLSETPTCILCFEADHTACHRDVIADAVTERDPGVSVIHL